MGFDTKEVGRALVRIFADMIFKHGFVHCDAHPGNILVRRKPRSKDFQIILLDHGLYRSLTQEFITDFSHLWISLIKQDKKALEASAKKLNIERHLNYLPIIFLLRTVKSSKKLGEPISPEERQYFR
jgi:aarF domain-containing kinase